LILESGFSLVSTFLRVMFSQSAALENGMVPSSGGEVKRLSVP